MKASIRKMLCALLYATIACAQPVKLKLTPADFDKWGTLSGEVISGDGRWVACRMTYSDQVDTSYVINTRTMERKSYPKGISVTFSPDSKTYVIGYPDKRLSFYHTDGHKILDCKDVLRFDILENGDFLIHDENIHHPRKLQLYNKKGVLQWDMIDVREYALRKMDLAVVSNKGVFVGELLRQKIPVMVLPEATHIISRLTWSPTGNSFGFFSQVKDDTDDLQLVHYNRLTRKSNSIASSAVRFEGVSYNISPYKMIISEDDKQVYFQITQSKQPDDLANLVEVWDSQTFLEYSQQALLNDPETHPYLVIWDVGSGKLQKPDEGDFINSRIMPFGKYVLSQSESSIVSTTTEFAPADYYSLDLARGKRTLIARQCFTAVGMMKTSPCGRYLAYFKNGHYFVFDNQHGKAWNITANIPVSFEDAAFDDPGENPGYLFAGWTTDSRYLLVYDQFDIWLFAPDGREARRITNGRPTKTRFRLDLPRKEVRFGDFARLSGETIDLKKGVLLSAKGDDYQSGLYRYDEKNGMNVLHYGAYKTGKAQKASDADSYIYTQETATQPPGIMIVDKWGKRPKMIFQSNPHYIKYAWSRSELITYKNSKGDDLRGVLMYPANYDAGKKYPMIVHIYERLSQTLYDYVTPVYAHHIGFSLPAYLHDGYFVLMPDIKYEIGNPGISAADCVTSAVRSVTNRNLVEEDHIGLHGHSFGGFQAAFIITQTPIFAAAVVGAGSTDPVSAYLTKNTGRYRSENWRFEDHQYRMASSPFNNWKGYIRNSTIAHAGNITTPLLNWSGKNDASINFEQGLELHLAMRALKKRNVFLIYPDQGHVLTEKEAKLDLTRRIKNWFDMYLKN